MGKSRKETYFLTKDLSYPRDGPIQLGAILEDPLKPTKLLHNPVTVADQYETLDLNFLADGNASSSVYGRIWASITQELAKFDIGGSRSKSTETSYAADKLLTAGYKTDPTATQAAEWVKLPAVKAHFSDGLFPRPVYIITAVKLVEGLKVYEAAGTEGALHAQGSGALTEKVSGGAEGGGEHKTSWKLSYKASDQRLFAYRVHAITKKLWSGKLNVEIHEDDAAFLGKDDATDDSPFVVELNQDVAIGLEADPDDAVQLNTAAAATGVDEICEFVWPKDW